MISVNVLGALYSKLPMVINDTSFGGELKSLLVRIHELNYSYIFVGIQFY